MHACTAIAVGLSLLASGRVVAGDEFAITSEVIQTGLNKPTFVASVPERHPAFVRS